MSGIGFLVGYFVMYSIRSGTKTQDAFKSFLGAGGLAGGIFLEQKIPNNLLNTGDAVLWGAGLYFLVSLCLSSLYSFSKKGDDKSTPPLPASDLNLFSIVVGRILLGEDFRTPAPK